MDDDISTPKGIGTVMQQYVLPITKSRKTERGELLAYFSSKLSRPIPVVATKLTGLKLPDLYYIKSDCDQAEARGVPWGAAFYTSLKPK